jgi:hypothetical protein
LESPAERAAILKDSGTLGGRINGMQMIFVEGDGVQTTKMGLMELTWMRLGFFICEGISIPENWDLAKCWILIGSFVFLR